MEKTFVMIKPDGIKRNLIGEIVSMFEKKGFKINRLELKTLEVSTAKMHYIEHQERDFYMELVNYITNGPVICMELSGENVIRLARKLCGDKDPDLADIGTIRGNYAYSKTFNLIHSSDSVESASRELNLHFK